MKILAQQMDQGKKKGYTKCIKFFISILFTPKLLGLTVKI